MKKVFNCLIVLFSLIVLSFFCILLWSDNTKPEEASYNFRFTFISPFANTGYWGSIAYGIKQSDQLYHTNTKCVGFLEADAEAVSEAIRSAVCSLPDGIITAGDSDRKVVSALKEAADAGIPVVLVDNDNQEVERLCYIGGHDYKAGQMAGRDITEGVSGPLYAAVIIGTLSNENQKERLRGFQEELALHPDCFVETVVEANYNLLMFREMLPRLLKENPKINAIFCAEGYTSIIAGEILTSMGAEYDDIRVVVFGNTEEILGHIASGRYYSTIVQDTEKIGNLAVEVLKNYQEGILPENDVIYIESISITRENVDSVTIYESEGVTWHLYNGNLLQTPQKEN